MSAEFVYTRNNTQNLSRIVTDPRTGDNAIIVAADRTKTRVYTFTPGGAMTLLATYIQITLSCSAKLVHRPEAENSLIGTTSGGKG